jgi:hypothetical protein
MQLAISECTVEYEVIAHHSKKLLHCCDQVQVTLRPTVSRPVRLVVGPILICPQELGSLFVVSYDSQGYGKVF